MFSDDLVTFYCSLRLLGLYPSAISSAGQLLCHWLPPHLREIITGTLGRLTHDFLLHSRRARQKPARVTGQSELQSIVPSVSRVSGFCLRRAQTRIVYSSSYSLHPSVVRRIVYLDQWDCVRVQSCCCCCCCNFRCYCDCPANDVVKLRATKLPTVSSLAAVAAAVYLFNLFIISSLVPRENCCLLASDICDLVFDCNYLY